MDFDDERKDRTAIHSKYADLEKVLASLKAQHITTVRALSDELDHQPPSLGRGEHTPNIIIEGRGCGLKYTAPNAFLVLVVLQ